MAKSQCFEKSGYILDLVMKARIQMHINQFDVEEDCFKHFPKGFLAKVDLTKQQQELLVLGDELKKNLPDKNSPFQNFLKYSPDALNHYFDQCLVQPIDCQLTGDTFFDFYLFKTVPWQNSEMDIFAAIIGASKEKFLLHPLFDAFLKLKWKKTCGLFYLYIVWILLYQIIVVLYSLNKFSFLNGVLPSILFNIMMTVSFGGLCFQSVVGFFIYLSTIFKYLKYASKYCIFFLGKNIFQCFCWNLTHPLLCGFLIFGFAEEKVSRSLCAVLIFMSSCQSMSTLARIPTIGIHQLMMTKVFYSVSAFFISFGAIFFSFCVIFHILLPDSPVFGSFGNAVIKVLAMLMGELDFTTNFVSNQDSGVISKIFFVLFLIMMALVFMNLLLGLAVSDIDELERISKVRRAVLEFETISIMEEIISSLRKIPCFMWINSPFITTENSQSYFTVVDQEPNSENK